MLNVYVILISYALLNYLIKKPKTNANQNIQNVNQNIPAFGKDGKAVETGKGKNHSSTNQLLR